MQVDELIKQLKRYPPDWEVWVSVNGRCSKIINMNDAYEFKTKEPCVMIHGEFKLEPMK